MIISQLYLHSSSFELSCVAAASVLKSKDDNLYAISSLKKLKSQAKRKDLEKQLVWQLITITIIILIILISQYNLLMLF